MEKNKNKKYKKQHSEGSMNLLALKGAVVKSMKFADGNNRDCLIIPIDIANLSLYHKEGQEDRCYLQFFINKVQSKFNTHCFFQKYRKEYYENSTPEERSAAPILGSANIIGEGSKVIPPIDDDLAF